MPRTAAMTLGHRRFAALCAAEHAGQIMLEPAGDGSDSFYVIDRSTAEPEVNWPGTDLGGPFPHDQACAVRDEARADAILAFVDTHSTCRWSAIADAPRDGTRITVLYDDGSEERDVHWAETRQCMLGSRAGECGPGWVSTEAGYLPVGEDPVITHFRAQH